MDQENVNIQLLNEMKELRAKIEKLEKDVEDVKYFTPKPVLTPQVIAQIGGFILGAIVLIGIFW
jgi:type II secretory pathway component PulM